MTEKPKPNREQSSKNKDQPNSENMPWEEQAEHSFSNEVVPTIQKDDRDKAGHRPDDKSYNPDLYPKSLPKLQWDDGQADKSLHDLFRFTTYKAQEAIDWYYRNRNIKRRRGLKTRYGAILLTGFAGLFPLLGSIFGFNDLEAAWWFHPGWASLAVGLAAVLVALDKFGGYSNSWMRYIQAAQGISRELDIFRFEWTSRTAKLTQTPDPEVKELLILSCRDFLLRVSDIVQQETEQWTIEFQAALKHIDSSVEKAAREHRDQVKKGFTGAINVRLHSELPFDDGWNMQVGQGEPQHFSGKQGTQSDVRPGLHALTVSAQIGGAMRTSAKTIEVAAGQITPVDFDLD